MTKLLRFFRLSREAKWLLLKSISLITVASLGVAVFPFSLLQKWSSRKLRSKPATTIADSQIGWAIFTASRVLPWSTCLAEALAAQSLLRHAGYEPVIRIGVRKQENGIFSAHAWVENDGKIVSGKTQDLESFERLPAF